MMLSKQKMNALRTELMRVKDASTGPKIRQCEERFTQLVGDIFIGKHTGTTGTSNIYNETFTIYVEIRSLSFIPFLIKVTRWFLT